MICGGTISGNCATGSPAIATKPPITVTIAMTIATMGRLMKNFEIIGFGGRHGPHAAILTGTQHVSRIREDARNPYRTRLLIDLPVGVVEIALLRIERAVSQI